MKNKYAGKCEKCGEIVNPECGDVKKISGAWVVIHDECPEITSGLGIGGVGSDDYDINTDVKQNFSTGKKRKNGGGQLWEECPRCGSEPVHLDCGYCDRHCQC